MDLTVTNFFLFIIAWCNVVLVLHFVFGIG
jgi:hypothetical protein